jgi:hypothetical protein
LDHSAFHLFDSIPPLVAPEKTPCLQAFDNTKESDEVDKNPLFTPRHRPSHKQAKLIVYWNWDEGKGLG